MKVPTLLLDSAVEEVGARGFDAVLGGFVRAMARAEDDVPVPEFIASVGRGDWRRRRGRSP